MLNASGGLTVILSREEVYTLHAAFEVLTQGDGIYYMLRLPEVVRTHKDLYRKFEELLAAIRADDSRKAAVFAAAQETARLAEPVSDPDKFMRCSWCHKEVEKNPHGLCDDCLPF